MRKLGIFNDSVPAAKADDKESWPMEIRGRTYQVSLYGLLVLSGKHAQNKPVAGRQGAARVVKQEECDENTGLPRITGTI